MRVLITVKTYPIPSAKYDELVCTAGITDDGDFVRLYPINFRDLPFSQQYKKYQWIEVEAERHRGRDTRRESYRPKERTLRLLGEPLGTDGGTWTERSRVVLRARARSMEELKARQERDRTSLGIIRPKRVLGLDVSADDRDWKPTFHAALKQARLFETRGASKEPPRKVPYKFHYRFQCDDPECTGEHRMMIEDWEVGALYWRLRDKGWDEQAAVEGVRKRFFEEICCARNDVHFYVGTVLAHPKSWLIIGTYYPRSSPGCDQLPLFS